MSSAADVEVAGNRRLTALAGALLLTPLALEGVTILFIGQLLWLHMFVGMLLLGPIALKLGSTGFRFAGYYAGRLAYRLSGPPAPPLRLLAIPLVLSTIVMMATGVALMLAGPSSRGSLLIFHKASFIVWVAVTAIHVLAHLQRVLLALGAESGLLARRGAGAGTRVPRARARLVLLIGALMIGALLAAISIPDFSPWQRARAERDHHRVQAAVGQPVQGRRF